MLKTKFIRFIAPYCVFAFAANSLSVVYAQVLPAGIVGDDLSLALPPPVLGMDSLGSTDALSLDALDMPGGSAGQDILLLGAPVGSSGTDSGGDSMEALINAGEQQGAVIEFLQSSEVDGSAVAPDVLTIVLPANGELPMNPEQADRNGGSSARDCVDRDRDGICDQRDQCPDTPADRAVMPSGCHFDLSQPLVLSGVSFAEDSALLNASSAGVLRRVADILKSMPTVRVAVVYFDGKGFSRKLGIQRAQSVSEFLVAEGVARDRLEPQFFQQSPGRLDAVTSGQVELRAIKSPTL